MSLLDVSRNSKSRSPPVSDGTVPWPGCRWR